MLLTECFENYIKNNEKFLKERTILTYIERKNMIIKKVGNLDIEEITQDFLQNYINEQQQNGRTKTAIQSEISMICASLKPIKSFNRFRYIATSQDLKRKKIYSEEDIEKIENYILEKNKFSYKPIMIAINTGMRLGEIVGLKWEDVDFENRVIKVCRNITYHKGKYIESLPKTNSGYRTIPINEVFYDYLKKNEIDNKNYFIVTNKIQTKNQRTIEKTAEKLCKKLGIEYVGFHSFRHSFATKLLKVSQDFKSIAQIMGHSNISITQEIYNHPSEEQRANVIMYAFDKEKSQEMQQNYQPQIEYLQNQINELRTIVSKIAQYLSDKKEEESKQFQKEIARNATRDKKSNSKYKIVSDYGKIEYYNDKKEMLRELDITENELKRHLNGYIQ